MQMGQFFCFPVSGTTSFAQSNPINTASSYLTVSQGTNVDRAIYLYLSAPSKTAITQASQSVAQYTVNATHVNGEWISLGRLQTDIIGNYLKMERSVFPEGDATSGSLPAQ